MFSTNLTLGIRTKDLVHSLVCSRRPAVVPVKCPRRKTMAPLPHQTESPTTATAQISYKVKGRREVLQQGLGKILSRDWIWCMSGTLNRICIKLLLNITQSVSKIGRRIACRSPYSVVPSLFLTNKNDDRNVSTIFSRRHHDTLVDLAIVFFY